MEWVRVGSAKIRSNKGYEVIVEHCRGRWVFSVYSPKMKVTKVGNRYFYGGREYTVKYELGESLPPSFHPRTLMASRERIGVVYEDQHDDALAARDAAKALCQAHLDAAKGTSRLPR